MHRETFTSIMRQADLFSLCFAFLRFADTCLQTEVLWQPCVEQVSQYHFSNSTCSLPVSESHFGN